MKRYFLHVGYPKCGSTFLQSRLFTEQNGIANLFLQTHLMMQHHLIQAQSPYYNHDLVSEEFESALRHAQDPSIRAVGISYEGLLSNAVDVELVAQRLSLLLPNPIIIIVIRNQEDIIVSNYVQRVRGGLYMSLDRFIESQIWNLQGSFMGLINYYRVAEIYAKIFGKDNIKLFCFEELNANPQAFVDRICDSIDIHPVKVDPTPVHVGHSPTGLLVLRAFNFLFRYGLGSPKFEPMGNYAIGSGRALVNNCNEPRAVRVDAARRSFALTNVKRLEIILKLKRHKMKIPDKYIPEFANLYGPGNSLLQSEYGLDLEKYGYPIK